MSLLASRLGAIKPSPTIAINTLSQELKAAGLQPGYQKLFAGFLKRLKEESLRFEEEISKVVAADDELSEYVKELKRREFVK